MADPKKMSVEEILAAARRMDGAGGESPSPAPAQPKPAAPASSEAASPESPAPAKPPASGKKPGEMSVADILAAARGEKKGAAAPGASPASAPEAGEKAPAPAKGAGPAKKPGEMSVADVLAAARAGKSAGADKPEAAKPAAPKPAAAKAPAKAAAGAEAKKAAKPAAAPLLDTASILAAARKGDKRGPVSKAEMAQKEAPVKAKAPEKAKLEAPPMPEKPAYARPQPAPARVQDRRGFFESAWSLFFGSSLAVGFFSLAATHVLWLLGLARFMFPNILTEPPTRFKIGFPDELGPGQVQEKFKAQFGVWIVRYEVEGQPMIYALKTVCTHLGCTPNWLEAEQKFKCPCHGSGFYKDGVNFEGPAPRPLERYAIRLADDGQLEVDKSRTFQQEMGQWSDTSSFVPV